MPRRGSDTAPGRGIGVLAGVAAGAVGLAVSLSGLAGAGTGTADGSPTPTSRATASPSPTSTHVTHATEKQRRQWGLLGYDRSYKADLLERLTAAPELVILGGSRAQRFDPTLVKKLTGLSAFNFALHNCRTADAYAVSKYLFARSPSTRLRCVWAVGASLLTDAPLDQALLYDERFAQWFPKALLTRQKKQRGKPVTSRVPSADVYSARGCIVSNGYDRRRAAGRTLATSLRTYLARMVPRVAATKSTDESLSKFYFRKTLRLYNEHGVTPVLVIMPYHPKALAAFRAVGWQKKLDRFKAYLARLHRRYRFRVVDCTEIESFGGRSSWFYDGAHITAENTDALLRSVVEQEAAYLR